MGWFGKKRNASAIDYRMRLAARVGSATTAYNLKQFIEEILPTVGPEYDGPRTWDEFTVTAKRMDAMDITEGRSRYAPSEDGDNATDLNRIATWLLGEHGVVDGVSYPDFKYRWE